MAIKICENFPTNRPGHVNLISSEIVSKPVTLLSSLYFTMGFPKGNGRKSWGSPGSE